MITKSLCDRIKRWSSCNVCTRHLLGALAHAAHDMIMQSENAGCWYEAFVRGICAPWLIFLQSLLKTDPKTCFVRYSSIKLLHTHILAAIVMTKPRPLCLGETKSNLHNLGMDPVWWIWKPHRANFVTLHVYAAKKSIANPILCQSFLQPSWDSAIQRLFSVPLLLLHRASQRHCCQKLKVMTIKQSLCMAAWL